MHCPILSSLAAAVAEVPGLPLPAGLGAGDVLAEQTDALARAVGALQAQLAVRMAARERHGPPGADIRGEAVQAGLGASQAARLRQLGVFAADHPDLRDAWLAGRIGPDHVAALRDAAIPLTNPDLRDRLVAILAPHLPDLDPKQARRAARAVADQLDPGDPDQTEQADHASRRLVWSRTPRGGIVLDGYLPAADAAAFTAAIAALAADLRAAGDGLTTAQRHADALAALVARADLPSGGGLPAAVTLTVSLDEARRVALRDPAAHGTLYQTRPRSGSTIGCRPAGDAAVRFGICCGAITPVLHEPPAGLLGRIAATPTRPLAVGRAVRLATPAQRTALQLRDGGCAIPGCQVAAAHTQPHHVTPYALDGPTDLDNLLSLCHVHHRAVELGRYQLIAKHPDQPRPPGSLEHPLWWIIPPRTGPTQ